LLGTRDQPGVTGWNRLEDRFFSEPALRSQFLKRLTELLKTEFTEQQLYPVLDRMEAEIAEDAPKDRRKWPGTGEDLRTGIRQVKSFIKNRRDFLLNEISRLEHNQVNNASR
jgi:spore coat protein CotH